MPSPTTRRVLLVEDDPDTRTNLRDILELDGYRLETAVTTQEAPGRDDWADLFAVILDRERLDVGIDSLLSRIRQRAPEAAVVIVTDHADLEETRAALRHGAVDYLPRPLHPDVLRCTLARAARLKEAEQRAVQAERLATIGQMVGMVAHEGRNALQRTRQALAMLALEVGDQPEALDLVACARRAQGELQRLFEDLRGYVVPLVLRREVCNLRILWREAWASLEDARARKAAGLREETDGIDLRCAVDRFRLEQVFRNLFENALAACPDRVEITVRCSPADLGGGPALRLSVQDNGPGLTPEQRQRAFEPFYTTRPKGTGLGLAIIRRIVEAHGGQITTGDVAGGAEFVLVLPRDRGAGEGAPCRGGVCVKSAETPEPGETVGAGLGISAHP
jgi:two-component system, NtrC family, sensor histidine kinase HydH